MRIAPGIGFAVLASAGLRAPGAEPAAETGSWVTTPFNGKDLDGWEARPGKKAENLWKVGKAEVDPDDPKRLVVKEGGRDLINTATTHNQSVDLVTQARYGDCRIELEVMVPQRSNSGIYVFGVHEIQVLDAYGEHTYPKGNMGAIYGVQGPSYFPARWLELKSWADPEWKAWSKTAEYDACVSKVVKKPGEWQAFAIEFRTPRPDAPARFLRVELNGHVIHENVEVGKPGGRSDGPLLLQGNHGPVAYRNIRITPLGGETRKGTEGKGE
jgi:hypothetical protein